VFENRHQDECDDDPQNDVLGDIVQSRASSMFCLTL
jgi:hypothetical protein